MTANEAFELAAKDLENEANRLILASDGEDYYTANVLRVRAEHIRAMKTDRVPAQRILDEVRDTAKGLR